MKVCFVCFGNICRSPTAEIVMREKVERVGLADRISVASAGVGASPGDPLDPGSAATLRSHGHSALEHSATTFGSTAFKEYDLVVVVDRLTALHVLLSAEANEDREKVQYLSKRGEVPNPWRGTEADYEEVYDLIDRACDELLVELVEQL
ncbi:low molecular weight protein-tyrosine-phosphatase [Microbacterium sp. NPDC079995]|uniref:low molecular weight protein-tyrosine-phosphatase n=1 Tax=unclassified Microbacterium TaxID=2609290 RepID=UPI00344B71CC